MMRCKILEWNIGGITTLGLLGNSWGISHPTGKSYLLVIDEERVGLSSPDIEPSGQLNGKLLPSKWLGVYSYLKKTWLGFLMEFTI
jgi:hypothetical protein